MSHLKVIEPGVPPEYIGRLHWVVVVPTVIAFSLAFPLIASAFYSKSPPLSVEYWAIALLLVVAGTWFLRLWSSTEIGVFQGHVVHTWAAFARQHTRRSVRATDRVRVSQGFLGRMLNFGTVEIWAIEDQPMRFVSNPHELARQLEQFSVRHYVGG